MSQKNLKFFCHKKISNSFVTKKSKFVFNQQGAAAEAAQRAEDADDGGEHDHDRHDESAEHDHDPHFEPIIPLPELVQVKTGEEDEEELFGHKAKMYRSVLLFRYGCLIIIKIIIVQVLHFENC